jgi:hypothetical protein
MAIQYDDDRRGAYVDPNIRGLGAPVALGRGNPQVDIQPTIPIQRGAP